MIFRNKKSNEDKVLIHTRTGEAYQPVRLYYEVLSQKTVIGAFKKLRCMMLDPTSQDHWQWLYDQEARKLRFSVSYNKVPKEYRPIVLGDFYFRDEIMILDLRSFDRAIAAIEFFDKRINRRAAYLTRMRVVNKYFDANETPEATLQPPFDQFFERPDLVFPDPREMEQQLYQLGEEHEDTEARIQAVNALLEAKNKQPLPEIEELPIHLYEDGIAPIQLALTMRQVEAMHHWQGDTSFSQYDMVQQMVASLIEKMGDEEFDDVLSGSELDSEEE